MTTWILDKQSPQHEQAELLRQKLAIEDEIKLEPNSELTRQFYTHWTKPFCRILVEKEADEPP